MGERRGGYGTVNLLREGRRGKRLRHGVFGLVRRKQRKREGRGARLEPGEDMGARSKPFKDDGWTDGRMDGWMDVRKRRCA